MKRKIALLFLLMGLVAQVFAYKKMTLTEYKNRPVTCTIYYDSYSSEKKLRKEFGELAKKRAKEQTKEIRQEIRTFILKEGEERCEIILGEAFFADTNSYGLIVKAFVDGEQVFKDWYNDFNSARADYDYLVNKYLKQIF